MSCIFKKKCTNRYQQFNNLNELILFLLISKEKTKKNSERRVENCFTGANFSILGQVARPQYANTN